MMKEGSRRRADAWTVWKVQLPYAIQLCEVSSRLERSLFGDELESYSEEGYRVWLYCIVLIRIDKDGKGIIEICQQIHDNQQYV